MASHCGTGTVLLNGHQFWLAIPATALGVVDATVGRRWGWFLGLAAGGVVLTIGLPLTPTAVSASTLYMTAALVGLAGLLVCLAVHLATPRIGFAASIGCLCIVLAGAAVLVLSCNLRIVGVYGIAAAAAVGPAILLAGTLDTAARAVAIVALCLLAGLLAGGHFYPEPGVPKAHFAAMLLAPASMLLGAAVPRNRRQWLRGVVAVGAVAITVAIVTVPVALEAKKAAEQLLADDPYAGYGY